MNIKIDDLTSSEVIGLINEHLNGMREFSPPESIHALPLEKLRQPSITFWSAWNGDELLGCGALKELDSVHGEVKSMRTASNYLRKGISKMILHHIIEVANQRGYQRLSLETGSQPAFMPARKLYEGFGFQHCKPFSDYAEDPNSVFMSLEI
ncbi:GNAT family N-acetyltransferase [Bacillus sp. EB01]|uniref:GNAT family N-acetyltransferase n=1 Tax=Bacillus sp. EB01 TaxID=1347086 RepID=UPI0005C5233C|nr:GNAT family N-acetyltransferase [Bacillus sp. EB01]